MSEPGVIIIGAGPAGLCTAFELKRAGVPCLVLEAGDVGAGQSWADMPTGLTLVSPWKCNVLSGDRRRFSHPGSYRMPAREYAEYLQDFARRNALPIRSSVRVRSVQKNAQGGFTVDTSAGAFEATTVVNATGYWSNPVIPEVFRGVDTRFPVLTPADYRDAASLLARLGPSKARPSVLIVGKRLTAGQFAVELHDAGFDVMISHRSPIGFGPARAVEDLFFRLVPVMDFVKSRLPGARSRPYDVKMRGGRARELIRTGVVRTVGDVLEVGRDALSVSEGGWISPDGVLLATGFLPALGHLKGLVELDRQGRPLLRGFESASCPGLFLLGIAGQVNFRSRFLRGIREDAARLVRSLPGVLR